MTPGDRDACRVYRDNHRGEQTRLEGLVDGEEYFVVLVTPGDPDSFVGISSIIRWTCPAPRIPSRSHLTAPRRIIAEPRPHSPRPESSSSSGFGYEGHMDVASGPASSPPPSSPLIQNSNGDIFTTPAREPTTAGSPPVASNPRPTSFSRCSLMKSPSQLAGDIFTTAAREPATAGSPPVASSPRPTSFGRCSLMTTRLTL